MTARRVLMVSPHFPPDTSAATHRVRLLAPAVAAAGWEPVVLTLTPGSYEGRLEPALLDLVPPSLRVERVPAWPPSRTRWLGVGDLGLRAWTALRARARALLAAERFDAVFWTVYPSWPASSGPGLAHEAGAAFVLDLQDPWVGAWGRTVGGGPGGTPDLKSRVTRLLSLPLERRTVCAADGLSGVSNGTLDEVLARVHPPRDLPRAQLPLVANAADVALARRTPLLTPPWNAGDGRTHLVWLGTLLPAGIVVMQAILAALHQAVERDPSLADRLRLHCFGTSNETRIGAPGRVMPIAREAGVEGLVTEQAERLDYLDALRILVRADAIVLGGSTEPHYTASRIYPALLAQRPLIAIYLEGSHSARALRMSLAVPSLRLVTFGGSSPQAGEVAELAAAITDVAHGLAWRAGDHRPASAGAPDALEVGRRLADLLERACAAHAARVGDGAATGPAPGGSR
ncbi:MAG: hypothetical protein HYX65_01230 [Gemmatimonadetes bacterium]|nr:hypothetical protein [Gemmatimonadota bacterium]